MTRRAFLGNMLRHSVATDFGEWTVDEPAGGVHAGTDDVTLVLAAESIHLMPRG